MDWINLVFTTLKLTLPARSTPIGLSTTPPDATAALPVADTPTAPTKRSIVAQPNELPQSRSISTTVIQTKAKTRKWMAVDNLHSSKTTIPLAVAQHTSVMSLVLFILLIN